MPIFQPSNVIPSSFAGVGLGTVDAINDEVNISWQVNGNSPMTAFKIQVFDNSSTSTAPLKDTGIITDGIPNGGFYGVDNKGNQQQFIYSPKDTSLPNNPAYTWESWGNLSNGNEYKLIITQYWGNPVEGQYPNFITQYSGSVFLTRTEPTLTLFYKNELFTNEIIVQSAIATFTADYAQEQGDVINFVRWQMFEDDSVIDDTGFINTSVLSYTYNGLFAGKTYSITCTIETQNGVQKSSSISNFSVEYLQADNSGKLSIQCRKDDSVLVSWESAKNIPGEMLPSGSTPDILYNGLLDLKENQSVLWNKVNDEPMQLLAPNNIAWKGKIGNVFNNTFNIDLHPEVTTQKFNITKDSFDYFSRYNSDYEFSPINGAVYSAYGDGIYVAIGEAEDSTSVIYTSTNGVTWEYATLLRYRIIDLTFGNGYFACLCERFNNSANRYSDMIFLSADGKSWIGVNPLFAPAKLCCITYASHANKFLLAGYSSDYSSLIFATSAEGEPKKFSLKYSIPSANVSSHITRNLIDGGDKGVLAVQDSSVISFNSNFFGYKICGVYDGIDTGANLGIGTYGNGKYVLYSYGIFSDDDKIVYISTNGRSWSKYNIRYAGSYDFDDLISITYGGGIFVASTLGSEVIQPIIYSKDGINWKVLEHERTLLGFRGLSVTYGDSRNDGRFVVVNSGSVALWDISYNYSQEYSIVGWLNKYDFVDNSNNTFAELKIETPTKLDGIVKVTISALSPINASITFTQYSKSMSGYSEINFNKGIISNVDLINIPTNIETDLTFTENQIKISASTLTPNGNTYTVKYNGEVLGLYNDILKLGNNDIIKTDKLLISIVKSENKSPYAYGVSIVNTETEESILSDSDIELAPLKGNYALYSLIIINDSAVSLIFENESGELKNQMSANVETSNNTIASIELLGPQLAEYLFITTNYIEYPNFTPSWSSSTSFFADFGSNQLQAGTASINGTLINTLYRIEKNNKLKFIANIPTLVNEFIDYGIKSNETYQYELFYLSTDGGYAKPITSTQVCKRFSAYTLLETVQDKEDSNIYHVANIWRFGNNLSIGSISNNNTPNWLTNFTPYRIKQPSSRLGKSGTLQALLSNYDISNNYYQDTVEMMESLYQASASKNTFFLKDIKGNLYMVAISAPITQTIELKSKVQQVKISVPWEEVGDASNVSIIQLPSDENYPSNLAYDVYFTVDIETGMLKVTYPDNYVGSIFELQNTKLIANTPTGVKNVDFSIVDGSVIATDPYGEDNND